MKVGVNVLVEEGTLDKLRLLASQNGRSVSGEARYALAQYVRDNWFDHEEFFNNPLSQAEGQESLLSEMEEDENPEDVQ